MDEPVPQADDEPADKPLALPVVDPRRLRRGLRLDAALRHAAVIVTLLAMLLSLSTTVGGGLLSLLVFLLAGLWVVMGIEGAKVARQLPELAAVLDHLPAQGEARLAGLLRRRLLPRWVRLMLWHRLAVVRHREGDYAASANLAQVLLDAERPGSFRQSHTHLWLVLLEARLELGDAWGAWLAIDALCRRPLGLTEALQRMALRTRYELLIGRDDAALAMAAQKLELSELMPGPQCGAFHAMLAAAARRAGHDDWSEHIWRKVALLCTAEQVERLRATPA